MKLYLLRHTESCGNISRKARNRVDGYDEMRQYVLKAFADPDIEQRIACGDWPSPNMKTVARRVRGIVEQTLQGIPDPVCPLSATGVEQAHHLGRQLKHHIADTLDAVVYSPYLRAAQTKNILSERWPALHAAQHIPDSRLREKHAGDVKKDYISYFVQHPAELLAAKATRLHYYYGYQPPHGENSEQVMARVQPFVRELLTQYRGKTVLVVAHKISLMAIMAHLEHKTSTEQFLDFDVPANRLDNGGFTFYHVPESGTAIRETHNHVFY